MLQENSKINLGGNREMAGNYHQLWSHKFFKGPFKNLIPCILHHCANGPYTMLDGISINEKLVFNIFEHGSGIVDEKIIK